MFHDARMAYAFSVKGKVWKYPGDAAWFFVYVDKKTTAAVKARAGKLTGWRMVPVTVTLGTTMWETSLFPTKEGLYLIALKAAVRKKEKVGEGTKVTLACVMR